MRTIDLMYRTMFAELVQRSLDASFETEFSTAGNFVRVPVKERAYWYFDEPDKPRKYVGPTTDPEIAKRVEAFKEIKDDLRSRRKLVSSLTREAGLTSPDRFSGDVIEALGSAGLFRLRGVLVGTMAFQTYAGYLGVRLPAASLQTGDTDFAQHYSISANVEDSIPPILDVLRNIDPTFREVPHLSDPVRATQFTTAGRFKVEFLTPNTGSDDFADRASPMPALGGAAAQPLRFLDYLIHEPVRTVMLHRSGVPVTVPAPERYAVHKLIVASRRQSDPNGVAKREKDVHQAALLFEALKTTRREDDLGVAFAEAWRRGPSWREAIERGLALLPEQQRISSISTLHDALAAAGEEIDGFTASDPADRIAVADNLDAAQALAGTLGIERAMGTAEALEWVKAHPDAEVHYQGPAAMQPAVAQIAAQARTTALYDAAQACVAELGREERFHFAKGAPLWSLEIADSAAERGYQTAEDEIVRDLMFNNIGITSQIMRVSALEARSAEPEPEPGPDPEDPKPGPRSSGSGFSP